MNKDIILCISPEWTNGGCGVLRVQHNVNYINQNSNTFGVKLIMSPIPLFDTNLLQMCRCVFIQRPFSPMPWLKNYKELQPKFGYSIVGEVDDNFTTYKGENIPDYNMASLQPRNFDMIDKISAENLQYIDRMITATDYLARILHEKFNYWNTVTIPNVCSRSLWGRERKDFFREKPVVLSAGAMQHYRSPQPLSPQFPAGVTALRGDYCGQWPEWIVKNANDMDLHFFADIPYFLSKISEKITMHPWKSTDMYISEYNRIRPDIVIAPLKDNIFNRCKSRLKFTEACAAGAILIGTDFEDSPYNCIHPLCKVSPEPTIEELDKVFKNVKEHWKEILDYQYKWINNNGEWLESNDHIQKWLTALTYPNQNFV